MNNALIIEQNNPSDAVNLDGLESEQELILIAKALEGLKSSVHFKRYIAKVVIPELERKKDLLSSEKNHDEICRLQGEIKSMKWYMNIEKLEHHYKVRFQRTHGKTR